MLELQFNQFNQLSQRNKDLIYLHKTLYDKLYLKNIQSCNTKQEIINQSNYYIPRKNKYKALHDNFLYYGSKSATSFIILDIDNDKRPLDIIIKEVKYKLQDIKTDWILKSDNGYHVGIILDNPVFFNDTYNTSKLETIKSNLSKILNADLAGSLRKYGFWRNPLTHNSYIRNLDLENNQEYQTLNEIYKKSHNLIFQNSGNLFNSTKENSEIQNKNKLKIQDIKKMNHNKINKDGFKKGNRNNFLFSNTIGKLYNGQITQDQIKQNLDDINQNELPEKEIIGIEKSIKKYNIKPLISEIQKSEYKPGPFHNQLWQENIHNYKINNKVKNIRQQVGQVISSSKILKKNIEILINGYVKMYQENIQFTNKNISIFTGFTIRTIQKYRNQRNIEKEIKEAAYEIYVIIKNSKEKKNVMPRFAPLKYIEDIQRKLLQNITLKYKNELVIIFNLEKDITFKIKDPNIEQIAA